MFAHRRNIIFLIDLISDIIMAIINCWKIGPNSPIHWYTIIGILVFTALKIRRPVTLMNSWDVTLPSTKRLLGNVTIAMLVIWISTTISAVAIVDQSPLLATRLFEIGSITLITLMMLLVGLLIADWSMHN